MKLETEESTRVQHAQLALPVDLLISSEYPVHVTRPMLWPFLVQPVIWSLVGICIIIFAQQNQLTFLSAIDAIISLGLIRTVIWWIGFAVLLAGFIGVFTKYLRWRYTIYSVTNRRILHQTGIVGKSYIDCPISKVQTLYLKISVLGRIFNFGTIRIATAGTSLIEMQWKYMKEPRKAHRILSEVIEQYRLEGEVAAK
jgi:uncharacterized membrane protein YdbT with pleckstrin-like domain